MRQPGKLLRRILDEKCLAIPGAFNGLVGRLCRDRGFQALYLSGAAISAEKGLPDIGLLTIDSFVSKIRELVEVTELPLLCDADTGFGDVEHTRFCVAKFSQAGAAGFHLEDQVFPKRCGHLEGKELIEIQKMSSKIEAAAKARDELTEGDFIVCARTDARGVFGMDEAVLRGKAYIEAGADMLFPEGLQSLDEFREFQERTKKCRDEAGRKVYLLANMTEFGKTPIISVDEFSSAGYSCVIFPVTTLRCAAKAVVDCLDDLRANGQVGNSISAMFTRKDLYETLRYRPGKPWDYPSLE